LFFNGFCIRQEIKPNIIAHLPAQKPMAWSWIISQMFFRQEPVQRKGAGTCENIQANAKSKHYNTEAISKHPLELNIRVGARRAILKNTPSIPAIAGTAPLSVGLLALLRLSIPLGFSGACPADLGWGTF
jgi:hypothetical protein